MKDCHCAFEIYLESIGFTPVGIHKQWSTYDCCSRAWYREDYGYVVLQMYATPTNPRQPLIGINDRGQRFLDFISVKEEEFPNFFMQQSNPKYSES